MGQQPQSASFWDEVRAWADSMGLLLPPEAGPEGEPARPRVPQAVCDSCPICQGAATLDQVNPQVVGELADLARGLIGGIGSALATAADQRLASGGPIPGQPDDSPQAAPDDPDPSAAGAHDPSPKDPDAGDPGPEDP
jgi:hypothetical protein